MKKTLSVVAVAALTLGIMGCNKADLVAKDKVIVDLKEKVVALETANKGFQAQVDSLKEVVGTAKVATKKAVDATKRASKRRRK